MTKKKRREKEIGQVADPVLDASSRSVTASVTLDPKKPFEAAGSQFMLPKESEHHAHFNIPCIIHGPKGLKGEKQKNDKPEQSARAR